MRRDKYYHQHIFYSKLCLLVNTQVHACMCVCAYIAFIMLYMYTQTYILLYCTFTCPGGPRHKPFAFGVSRGSPRSPDKVLIRVDIKHCHYMRYLSSDN